MAPPPPPAAGRTWYAPGPRRAAPRRPCAPPRRLAAAMATGPPSAATPPAADGETRPEAAVTPPGSVPEAPPRGSVPAIPDRRPRSRGCLPAARGCVRTSPPLRPPRCPPEPPAVLPRSGAASPRSAEPPSHRAPFRPQTAITSPTGVPPVPTPQPSPAVPPLCSQPPSHLPPGTPLSPALLSLPQRALTWGCHGPPTPQPTLHSYFASAKRACRTVGGSMRCDEADEGVKWAAVCVLCALPASSSFPGARPQDAAGQPAPKRPLQASLIRNPTDFCLLHRIPANASTSVTRFVRISWKQPRWIAEENQTSCVCSPQPCTQEQSAAQSSHRPDAGLKPIS